MDEFDKKIYLFLRKRLRTPIENSWKLNQVKKNNSSNEITRGFSNYTDRDLTPFSNEQNQNQSKNNDLLFLGDKTYIFSPLNHNCIKLLSKRKK